MLPLFSLFMHHHGQVICSVADPDLNQDPDPPDPHVFGLLDPDPDSLIRGIRYPDLDASITMQK